MPDDPEKVAKVPEKKTHIFGPKVKYENFEPKGKIECASLMYSHQSPQFSREADPMTLTADELVESLLFNILEHEEVVQRRERSTEVQRLKQGTEERKGKH